MKLDSFLSLILVIKTSDDFSDLYLSLNSPFDNSDIHEYLEIYEENNKEDDLSPLIRLNNQDSFQGINSQEIFKESNNREVIPFHDTLLSNFDEMFNNINGIETYSQSVIQETSQEEKQSYERERNSLLTPLLDCNPTSDIQLEKTEKEFVDNNSNIEGSLNDNIKDVLSNEGTNKELVDSQNVNQDDTNKKIELIPLSCEGINEFFEEINDSNLLSSDPEKIETEINYDKVKLLERNTEETINPLTPSTLINNNEMVNYYFIDFNTENNYYNEKEIQPLLVSKKQINNQFSLNKMGNNIWEINFNLNNNYFTWRININKPDPLILNLSDKSSSIKIIKEKKFKEMNIYNSKDFLHFPFEVEYSIFRKIDITTSRNIKYLKISIDCLLKENINKKITGNIFLTKLESNNLKSPLFLINNSEEKQKEVFYNFLDLKFPIYNLIEINEKSYIPIYNTQYTSSSNNISIKDYMLEFNKIKNSFKISAYKLKYKSIDKMPIIKSPNLNSSPIIKFQQAIFLIKDFCILFIENINEVERIILDSSNITKNEEIKIIFENIIPNLIPNWRIRIKKKLNEDDYKEIKLISFYMFLHQQIREILEKWDKIILKE